MVVMGHRMAMVAHGVVNAMMMRAGRSRAGRQGQHESRGERQGDEFQDLSPGFR
jgi:hypothetical protein